MLDRNTSDNVFSYKKKETALNSLFTYVCHEAAIDFFNSTSDITEKSLTDFFLNRFKSTSLLSKEFAVFCNNCVKIDSSILSYRSDDDLNDKTPDGNSSILFLNNPFSDHAFKLFSNNLANVSGKTIDSFKDIFEEINSSGSNYGIIPIFSSSDGLISSLWKQVLSYDMKIILETIITLENENQTRFALIGKKIEIPKNVEYIYVLYSIVLSSEQNIFDLLSALSAINSELISINAFSPDKNSKESNIYLELKIQQTALQTLTLFFDCSHLRSNLIGCYKII